MSDPAPALLLVARRAGERLEELVPLVRAVREACGLDAPPSLSLHYRTRTRTLALAVAGALPGGPKGVAREVLDGWRGSWRLQAVAPPVEAVAGLLAPFDVVIPNLLDTLGALARLQEAASAARPERRRGRRYPAGTLEARFDAGGRAHSGRVWDLSTGGCFVALEAPRPPVGEVVNLVLGDAGTDAGTDVGSGAAIAARVVFHLPESRAAAFDRAPGVGLHFVGVSATARAVLTDLIGRAAEARGAQGPGRRLETRLPIILTVSLKTDAGVVECRAENLSAGGIFVATDNPPVPGTPVELRLELPGEPLPLALPATVRHLVPPGDAAGRHPGAGSPSTPSTATSAPASTPTSPTSTVAAGPASWWWTTPLSSARCSPTSSLAPATRSSRPRPRRPRSRSSPRRFSPSTSSSSTWGSRACPEWTSWGGSAALEARPSSRCWSSRGR